MRKSYIDAVLNSISEAKAWRASTIVLGALCTVLAIGHIYRSANQTVVLIPNNLATETGRFVINGSKPFESSVEYIQQIALSDASLAMNWTPDTIAIQYQRLLNRMTESLYRAENVRLTQQAMENKQNAVTQSFYPSNVYVNPETKSVDIKGLLIRYSGDKETVRLESKLTITYETYRGYLHVSALKLQ